MKSLFLIFALLCFRGFSQNYTFFDTYNIHEFFSKQELKWKQVESDSAMNHLVWNVFFEKENGIIMFQDSATGDFFKYKIMGLEVKNDVFTYKSLKKTTLTSKDIYIYFYEEDGFKTVKIDDPEISIRFKHKL